MALTAYGFAAFPVPPPDGRHDGKAATVKDWGNVATDDVYQLVAWRGEHPGANVGIVPRGQAFVLDLDDAQAFLSLLAARGWRGSRRSAP